jgi:hypothetical protein
MARSAPTLGQSISLGVRATPNSSPTPSRADIPMTKQIVEVAKPLGISVHDHIIVSGSDNDPSCVAFYDVGSDLTAPNQNVCY